VPLNHAGRKVYSALIVLCLSAVVIPRGFAASQLGTPIDILGMNGKVIVNDRGEIS
jgi:hypothetical protein